MSESTKQKSPFWRVVRLVLGLILLPLGIIGLFLPFLQGVLFLIVALALLADEIPFLARIRDRIHERYPAPWEQAERFRSFLSRPWKKPAKKEPTGDESRSL